MSFPQRQDVLQALIESLDADLASITASQRDAQEGATHEEARAEGDKDMRSTEVSYLARGLAIRVTDLREATLRLKGIVLPPFSEDGPVRHTSLFSVEDEEGEESLYFMAPTGGGKTLLLEGSRVRVITEESPLGEALWGKAAGDDVDVAVAGKRRELVVTRFHP